METKKFYKFSTAAGMLHAEVIPTMQALGDQPWAVRVRDTKGVLLLSCTTEEMSGQEAATGGRSPFPGLQAGHKQ